VSAFGAAGALSSWSKIERTSSAADEGFSLSLSRFFFSCVFFFPDASIYDQQSVILVRDDDYLSPWSLAVL